MTPPRRPLRVMMTTDAVGGVWIYASTLARALCRRGLEVSLVTLGPAPRPDQLDSIAEIPGLTLETTDLALEWIDPEGMDFQRATDRLLTIEDRVGPDVVHLNSYREAMSAWRTPVIVVAHSCVRSWWLACRGEEPSEPRWSTYMENVYAGLSAATRWLAPTRSFRNTVAELYEPESAGLVIPNGIEQQLPGTRKQRFILAAGRQWDEAKNLSMLRRVASRVPWPIQTNGPIDICRDDGGQAEPSNELSHPVLLEAMRRASILASPAVYEPFGLTILEGAAAGCALVLSDIETLRELWDGAALFVEARDEAAWQAALTSLTRDDAMREYLQKRAADRAQSFTLDVTVDAYVKLYLELASGGRARGASRSQSLAEVQP
jgi:glycosyltransferase involved in cell wall biosynthesis